MGLFDRKFCDICGEKIGLLGNRKLEDGNLCKNCAAKLSPFFSERRHSTVAEIKEQLDYREANKAAVAAFHTTKTLGLDTRLLVDEDAGKFMVTSSHSLETANPDVIDLSDVTGCTLDTQEHRTELKMKDREGKEISYNPPRYETSYDYYIVIAVNSPYFDTIRFKLNRSSVKSTNHGEMAQATGMASQIKQVFSQDQMRRKREAAAAAAPKKAVTCPWCGATTIPDESGCCEYCGGSVKG